MTLTLGHFNTSAGPQLAVLDIPEGSETADTVVVLSETDADGLTDGQIAFKHSISPGTEPGTYVA